MHPSIQSDNFEQLQQFLRNVCEDVVSDQKRSNFVGLREVCKRAEDIEYESQRMERDFSEVMRESEFVTKWGNRTYEIQTDKL